MHLLYAESLSGLGFLYFELGDYAKAEPLCRKGLAIRKKALGEMHPLCAGSSSDLGNLYRAKGDYAKAESFYRQGLEIRKKALGECTLTTPRACNGWPRYTSISGTTRRPNLL